MCDGKAAERSQEVMECGRKLAGVREKLKRPARVSRSKEKAVEKSCLGEKTKMQHGH